MTTLPTGTVTFLFTDIEGSTRAWESHPDAMASALVQHDKILRDAVANHGGYVFKTVGDEFCCAFADPASAVWAAVEVERSMQQQGWPAQIGEIRVRVGIHTGAAVERDGDYFGPTVNRVARLMSIAHGGQVLLSSSAAAALSDVALESVSLRDLGSHRLKDLKQAESTYQLVAPGLRGEFPSLASLDAHPNNLPSQFSTFIGRESEIAAIRNQLSAHRLVTITGPGGVGKTRLALQIAADVVQGFPDGVFLVALAPIASGELVPHALASAIEVAELPSEPLEDTVVRCIGRKSVLFVFDNSEHVSSEVATIIKRIVSECPNVRCLVTGREPLHLVGENVERLEPLATPADARTVADLEALDGTRLFLERARAVVSDFSLADRDSSIVAEVCRRLEGIPLAIELAASRLATMPLPRLAQKLNVSILVNKDPTASLRHRTLRDAIEWSYRLLAEPEQRTFLALAVFAGGLTVDALDQVIERESDDDIGSLVDKSLVQRYLGDDGNVRYRLLEPIAEFAVIELAPTTLGDGFHRRHFDVYNGIARVSSLADGPSKQAAFDRVERELGNVRTALDWAAERDVELAAQLATDLGIFWRARGFFSEGRTWFSRVLAHSSNLSPRLRASVLRQSAGLAAVQDDYAQSIRLATEALTAYRELGDEAGIGLALHTLAEVAHRQGRLDQANRLYRDAFQHLDAADHLYAKTICLMNQGMIARQRNDLEGAAALLREAGAHAERLRDPDVSSQVKVESGWAMLLVGSAELAELSFREAFASASKEHNLHGTCQARLGIATAALVTSRIESALQEFKLVLQEASTLRAQIFVVEAIYGLGAVNALCGDLLQAARCCGLAVRIADETKCEPRAGVAYKIVTERIRLGLSRKELAGAMNAGASMQLEDGAALFSELDHPRDVRGCT